MDYTEIPSPCFVLEESKLEANLKVLDSIQKDAGIDIILAFKGFAMWKSFPLVRKYLKGATASSLHEVKLCADEMKVPAHTYAVAYKEDEIDEILKNSSHITFNSINQFEQFKAKAKKFNVSCGLRINPEQSDVKTDLYNPSSPNSRLGIISDHFPEQLPEEIEGLHFHVLCESDSYALENVLKAIEKKFGKYMSQIKWLNMGGGHLMTRKDYDINHLIGLLTTFRKKYNVQIILEPGSAVAWQTGFLKTTVLDIIESKDVETAIIDASFTCHMPDCLEMPYRPSIVGAKENPKKSKHQYRLGGISCLAGDFLESYGFDHELIVGDEIVFEDMMHYTMVKTTTFNGIQHPSIGVIKSNSAFKLIKKFDYKHYKNKLS